MNARTIGNLMTPWMADLVSRRADFARAIRALNDALAADDSRGKDVAADANSNGIADDVRQSTFDGDEVHVEVVIHDPRVCALITRLNEALYQDFLNQEIPFTSNQADKDELTRPLCHSLKVFIQIASAGKVKAS
ncbi:hypothetical protein AWB79_01270 [Caballeronia hypogeia]|uniref:Uncharacterized protein n=1 Tax=Caballeronia hypogeia TaxID=1777140 RepID=A0A157ZRW8_9BURK|nr:hypothetical protein [Caballeronia hypogeia]SAK48258.1 hypothetical protein AWB79_01270 [Caballeronia hypogeia]